MLLLGDDRGLCGSSVCRGVLHIEPGRISEYNLDMSEGGKVGGSDRVFLMMRTDENIFVRDNNFNY